MKEISKNQTRDHQGEKVKVITINETINGTLSGTYGSLPATLEGNGISNAIFITVDNIERLIYADMIEKIFIV